MLHRGRKILEKLRSKKSGTTHQKKKNKNNSGKNPEPVRKGAADFAVRHLADRPKPLGRSHETSEATR